MGAGREIDRTICAFSATWETVNENGVIIGGFRLLLRRDIVSFPHAENGEFHFFPEKKETVSPICRRTIEKWQGSLGSNAARLRLRRPGRRNATPSEYFSGSSSAVVRVIAGLWSLLCLFWIWVFLPFLFLRRRRWRSIFPPRNSRDTFWRVSGSRAPNTKPFYLRKQTIFLNLLMNEQADGDR